MRIYRFPLAASVDMPQGAVVLSVQKRGPDLSIWALVDPQAPMVARRFRQIATGDNFDPTGYRYVTTYRRPDAIVMHVYEEVP